MSAVKKYLIQETQLTMLALEHSKPPDFYLSVWQTNRSAVPLLIFRTLLFLASVGIVLSSIVIYIMNGKFGFWFIYLTHWGLTLIVLSTGFATLVSARCYIYGPISSTYILPWYVKIYWVLYNTVVPVAFLITVFYWTVLFEAGIEEELNHGLDVAVHGLNSLVIFLLVVTSSHPSRLLHIYQPLVFALTYMLFGVIYHFAGGTDQKGNPWIYPVINWATPVNTLGYVTLTGLLLVFLHLLAIGLAAARDALASACIRKSIIVHVHEGVPLRQPNQTNIQNV